VPSGGGGGCDVAEHCTSLGVCPADGFALIGTSCGSGATECSGQDTCDGAGGCLPNHFPSTTTCGSSVTQYQCSTADCLATPQSRTVGQHCSGGACVDDTGVTWVNLGSACLSSQECIATASSAACYLCDDPPDDYCSGGNAYHYYATGSCAGGDCSYSTSMETCTYGCASGSCSTSTTIFFDDFEDGNYTGWTAGTCSNTRSVTSTTAADGTTYSLYISGACSSHYGGLYHVFSPTVQPTHISYWARSSSTTLADGYFVVNGAGTPGTTNQMAFIYFNSDGYMNAADSAAAFYPYSANVWYHIELRNINWSTHRFDIYVNGILDTSSAPFRANISGVGRIDLYNFGASSAYWDQILLE